MRKTVVATAIGASLALTACGSSDSGTIETADGDLSYSLDNDDGGISIEASTEDGEFSFTTGEGLIVDMPDGFTVYPGAEVISSVVVDQADGKGMIVVLNGGGSPDEMADHYQAEALAAGFEIEFEMNSGGARMMAGEDGDGKVFNFNVNTDDDGATFAQLLVGQDLN